MVLQGDYESSDSACANDKEELSKSILYKEAHSAIQTTLMFLGQKRDDNVKVSRDNLLIMRRYRKRKVKSYKTRSFVAASTSK